MSLNIILVFVLLLGLLFDYKKTILKVACLYPILDMLGGVGPISLMKVYGLMAIVVAFIKYRRDIKRSPVMYVAVPFLVICLISNYINEHHSPTMLGFMSTSILLPIIMLEAVGTRGVKLFLKIWTLFFLVVCIYGYIEAFTNSNPFAEWACNEKNTLFGGYYSTAFGGTRFGLRRIQSIMIYRDACGANSALFWGFLYYIRTYKRSLIDSKWMEYATTALMFMLPITVLLTGTRACIAILLVCMLGTIKRINAKYIVIVCVVCIIAFTFAEPFLNSVYQSFADTDNVEGSNIDMRQQQLTAVLLTLKQSPIFGNGFGSWHDYSEWADELLGAESLWFQLLLKVGILGTFTFVLMITVLIYHIAKTQTPYAFVILIAFFVGLTLSSLPGFDTPLLFLFIGIMIDVNSVSDIKTKIYEHKNKLSSINLRTRI